MRYTLQVDFAGHVGNERAHLLAQEGMQAMIVGGS
jgi:hypothetical protein